MNAGSGTVKGWPRDIVSHTNAVVALLHWKGGLSLSHENAGEKWSIWSILDYFFIKTKVADQFSVYKIGNEGL